jgi:hypothetical protein
MLADPIAIVDEMARGKRPFGAQVNVAGVAVARVPLILVAVTAEARGHVWAERGGPRRAHLDMATHAVPAYFAQVPRVLESQVLARKFCAAADVRFAVAEPAVALVVGFCVASDAVGGRGEVQGPRIARSGNPRVTLEAAHPFQHVCAVLERMRR